MYGFALPAHTQKNILWYDLDTNRIKIAFHVHFDEGMNDLTSLDLPPNVRHLQQIHENQPIPPDADPLNYPPNFSFSTSPFTSEHDKMIRITCTDPFFGLRLQPNTATNRAYVTDIEPNTSSASLCSRLRASHRKYVGAFLTAVNNVPVFNTSEAESLLSQFRVLTPPPSHPSLTFAPEPLISASARQQEITELAHPSPSTPSDLNSDNDLRISPVEL